MPVDGLRRAIDQPICATVVGDSHPSRGRESNAVANRFANPRRYPGADAAASGLNPTPDGGSYAATDGASPDGGSPQHCQFRLHAGHSSRPSRNARQLHESRCDPHRHGRRRPLRFRQSCPGPELCLYVYARGPLRLSLPDPSEHDGNHRRHRLTPLRRTNWRPAGPTSRGRRDRTPGWCSHRPRW